MASKVLFSAVRGKVLLDDQPVAGALLERTFHWGWKDETGSDRTTTDAQGEFRFGSVQRRTLLGSLLPHEPLIKQEITITHAGRTYTAWAMFKRDYADNGELSGRPIVLTCRLDSEPQRRGDVFGIGEAT